MGERECRFPIKVAIWGIGAMGSGIGEIISERQGYELIGAVDHNAKQRGVAILGGIAVSADPQEVLEKKPDVVVISTSSFVRDVKPQVLAAVRSGANVITIAEEMAYPWVDYPAESEEMDSAALSQGVTVLGTGINPGFMLDTLIIAMTAVCRKVEAIRARRVNDLSPFGPTVLRTQGVGASEEGFRQGLGDGSIVGHIGFRQSIYMIGSALGWQFDRIVERREPIITRTRRQTRFISIEPGQVAGCNHTAEAYIGDRKAIVLEHPQQIVPACEGVETGDYITIEGVPSINLSLKPEVPGGIGTMSIVANLIPQIAEARPGLISMKDLRLPCGVGV